MDLSSKVDEEGWDWICARNLSVTEYCDNHGVVQPSEVTPSMIPDHDNENVQALDRKALEEDELGGKWNIFGRDEVDQIWQCVVGMVESGERWRAKVSTLWDREVKNRDNHVTVVYSPN